MSTPESNQHDLDDLETPTPAEATGAPTSNGGGVKASMRVAGLVALSTAAVIVLGKLAELLVGPRP
ncbi:MAG: hypothetical protein U0610_32085 [bacterium]